MQQQSPGDPEQRRTQQTELYGASVDRIVDVVQTQTGLGPAEIASTIGVSVPMFTQVHTGRRVRIGNPAAIRRLRRLHEFAEQLAEGLADVDDIGLTVAQIKASSGRDETPLPTSLRGATDDPDRLTRSSLERARALVSSHVKPTPARRWPRLEELTGVETWVKHENFNPTGAFKVRGGLTFVDRLLREQPSVPGIISATQGSHGQSLGYAGRALGLPVVIVVPETIADDREAAIASQGAEVIRYGGDFQEAREHSLALAEQRGLRAVPPFHPWLVTGVATYPAELHESVPDLDTIYVPVGMGSGLCANIWVRDLLRLGTEIVGVVADGAPTYALSVAAGRPVPTQTVDTFVEGTAVRTPDPEALAIIRAGAARILRIGEDEARFAMAAMNRRTRTLTEPAGALALAGLLAERDRMSGRRVGLIDTGAGVDFEVLSRVLAEHPSA